MTTPVFLPEEIVFDFELAKPIKIVKLEKHTKNDLGHMYMLATNKVIDIQFFKKEEIIKKLRSCEKFKDFLIKNNREYSLNSILDEN